jgi:hypothetical protein
MKRAEQLTTEELRAIVNDLQELLYLDIVSDETGDTDAWNPNKEWDCCDICAGLSALAREHELVPDRVTPLEG